MIDILPGNIIRFFVLVLLQVLVLNNVQLTALQINPYVYVLFVLLLPFETPGWLLLVSAFLIGISVDIFSDTIGLHATATVFMAFLRPYILQLISTRDGYEIGTAPRLSFYGFFWFVKYATILIFAHHIAYFYAEAFSFSEFFFTFLKAILSTIFTGLLVVLSQYFIYKK